MQMLAMCESRPRTVANERAHGLFHRRLRQSLIDSKGSDALVVNNTRVAGVLSDAHIEVNILRGQPVVPRFK
jgi:hypothetical protein